MYIMSLFISYFPSISSKISVIWIIWVERTERRDSCGTLSAITRSDPATPFHNIQCCLTYPTRMLSCSPATPRRKGWAAAERVNQTRTWPLSKSDLFITTECHKVLEFSVGAFLSRMCSPCALTLNSMFAEYAFAFPHSRNRCLVKTSKHRTAWTPVIDTY